MFYFYILIMFISFNSIFLFWLFLELNMVIFLLLIRLYRKTRLYHLFFYFLIQSFSSVLMLFFTFNSFFSLESFIVPFFTLIVFLKIGTFPFYEWVISTSKFLNDKIICLLLRFQKFPLFLLLFYLFDPNLILILIVNIVFGRAMVYFSSNLISLIIFSSVYSTFWFFSRSRVDYVALLFFITQYIFLIWWLFQTRLLSMEKSIILVFTGFFLIGMPPFFLFFLKYNSILYLVSDLSIFLLIVIWLRTFVSFMGYIKFFIKGFLRAHRLYTRRLGHLLLSLFLFISGSLFIL